MKALVHDTYGSSDVLQFAEVEMPVIGDDDVLLQVRAASLHRGDWHMMTGLPSLIRVLGFGLRRPRQRVMGMDVAGVVHSVGSRVTDLKPGDEVFGVCRGSLAEYAGASAKLLVRKPAGISFEQAAAVPTSAVSALQGLRDGGRLTAGQRVLVIGAAGGVGIFAVQLARELGGVVTGVCSTAKVELVRSLGADAVIDYTRDGLGTERYDVILDLAGNRPLSLLRRSLTATGTLVIVGGENGGRILGGFQRSIGAMLLAPFVRQRLTGLAAVQRGQRIPSLGRADLLLLADLLAAGSLTPVIHRTYPLADAIDAMRMLESGDPQGKLVVTP
ncbi:MAG: NAD(P)-dependent alcohol dehydrogenase [Actinomycetota bacterium]